VDAHTRKLAGWVIAAIGVVIAIVGALADQIGLGESDNGGFGGRQVAAVIVGVVVALIGLGLAYWSQRSEPNAAGGQRSQPTAAGTPPE
jgi:hypothetical protein